MCHHTTLTTSLCSVTKHQLIRHLLTLCAAPLGPLQLKENWHLQVVFCPHLHTHTELKNGSWDKISLRTPDYTVAYCADQASLEPKDSPASQSAEIKACTSMPRWDKTHNNQTTNPKQLRCVAHAYNFSTLRAWGRKWVWGQPGSYRPGGREKKEKKKQASLVPTSILKNSQMPVTPALGNQTPMVFLNTICTHPHTDIHKKQ